MKARAWRPASKTPSSTASTAGRRAARCGRGTGLGLPIARELASRWDGTVTLSNAPGGGAVATVTLPLATGAAPATAILESSAS
jgi:signal transduction histidine kinase